MISLLLPQEGTEKAEPELATRQASGTPDQPAEEDRTVTQHFSEVLPQIIRSHISAACHRGTHCTGAIVCVSLENNTVGLLLIFTIGDDDVLSQSMETMSPSW